MGTRSRRARRRSRRFGARSYSAIKAPSLADEEEAATEQDELAQRFEEVLALLAELDLQQVWSEPSDAERRVLIDELLDRIIVYPDHLEVVVHGVPKINVLLSEVGLAESQNKRVGGPASEFDDWRLRPWSQIARP